MLGNRSLTLPKGTAFTCALKTKVVSAASGFIGCQVLRNVYSDDGRVLLIERGSHMDGEYRASSVRPGTVRIPVMWTRIAEVKEIVPARYGYKAFIKHLPDQPFAIDAQHYLRTGRQFENELSLWGATDALHMVMIATFHVSEVGIPIIAGLSLMPATRQWLPIEDTFEKQLIERLVHDSRSFVKCLRYNVPAMQALASVVLTDFAESPIALCMSRDCVGDEHRDPSTRSPVSACTSPAWIWRVTVGEMPSLPPQGRS